VILSLGELSSWFAAVPDYQRFLTLKELDESSRSLADEFPDWVNLQTVGHSNEGRPINLLTVGKGSRAALLIGAPHPNEPIGTLTLDFMARRLCEDRKLAVRRDCQFHFIKVAGPDGLNLNEGWLKNPFTPLSYALNYYSPPHAEQVEWGFPIRYKALEFTDPPSETRAVMSVMHRYRPRFLYSLHNGIFCGVYFYLSRRSTPLFEALHAMVSELGMTPRGEPDGPLIKP
jgi:Zinc carboxypeptidase